MILRSSVIWRWWLEYTAEKILRMASLRTVHSCVLLFCCCTHTEGRVYILSPEHMRLASAYKATFFRTPFRSFFARRMCRNIPPTQAVARMHAPWLCFDSLSPTLSCLVHPPCIWRGTEHTRERFCFVLNEPLYATRWYARNKKSELKRCSGRAYLSHPGTVRQEDSWRQPRHRWPCDVPVCVVRVASTYLQLHSMLWHDTGSYSFYSVSRSKSALLTKKRRSVILRRF